MNITLVKKKTKKEFEKQFNKNKNKKASWLALKKSRKQGLNERTDHSQEIQRLGFQIDLFSPRVAKNLFIT